MKWKFGKREIEIEEGMKWRRHIDHDTEKPPLPEQKPIAKNRSFPLKKIHRKVAFIFLVVLEPTLLTSDTSGFLWEALCRAWAWQSDRHRSAGHKYLCETLKGLQTSFLLGSLSNGLGGIVLLSLACEAVDIPASYIVPSTCSLFYFSTINSHNNFCKICIWELKS